MMASHIAHEFNNYLTPVLIYAELLENDESISSENQEMIHEITKSVDQASNLSKELLAFSRQDTGVRLEPLNFTEEVKNAVSIVRQLAPAAIMLKTEITEEPLYVLGRRRMAEHILMNLCKTRFRTMERPRGKELWIRLAAKGTIRSACRYLIPAAESEMMPCRRSLNRSTQQKDRDRYRTRSFGGSEYGDIGGWNDPCGE